MTSPPLHPDCEPLAFLLGRWEGEGAGLWPAEPQFMFREEAVIDHIGKPFLRYGQRTWAADDGRPMHSEAGFIRPVPGGGVEMLVVQPIGVAEVHAGRLTGRRLELELVHLGVAPSAKPVTGVSRCIWADGDDTLRYLLRIALNGEPLADHLEATLRRT